MHLYVGFAYFLACVQLLEPCILACIITVDIAKSLRCDIIGT